MPCRQARRVALVGLGCECDSGSDARSIVPCWLTSNTATMGPTRAVAGLRTNEEAAERVQVAAGL